VTIRLVAFDLDGTLVDSLRDLAEAVNDLLAERGASPLPLDEVARMVGDGAATLVARATAAAGLPPSTDALARFLEIYDARLLAWTRPYPGIPELLAALKPRVRLAVLTNKPLAATRAILSGLALDAYFEEVVGGDGPFPRKPDPAGLRHLMHHADADPAATLLVGDSRVDWQTAQAAGSQICLVRYGFGFGGVTPVQRGSARLIDRPMELLSRL
jgi:phosphoglycolate phosphatase